MLDEDGFFYLEFEEEEDNVKHDSSSSPFYFNLFQHSSHRSRKKNALVTNLLVI